MKKLEFSIEIKASKEKVCGSLWHDQNYRKWTAIFLPGSYYEGELKENSDVRFFSLELVDLGVVLNIFFDKHVIIIFKNHIPLVV